MDSIARDLRYDPAVVLAHTRPFRLGAVEVRPATREVLTPAGREVLEPRVMQVLVALARADGEFLTRDDLIASCWDGRVVGEDAITRVMSRLRRLTEGLGQGSWTLETVTKVGYRLVAAGQDPEAAVRAAPERMATSRRWLFAGGGAAVVAAAGGVAAWRWRKSVASPRAQGLYRRAREIMWSGEAGATAQAIGFLREAVADSPGFASGWGALAQAYWGGITFAEPARQEGIRAQAEAAARRAHELDPDDPDAMAAWALLAPIYGHWLAAERQYLRALAKHPPQPQVEAAYSRLLQGVGRLRDALESVRIAVAADPYAPYWQHGLGMTLWSLGRTEEAETVLRKALALWPRHHAVWFALFYLLTFSGRAEQALAMATDVAARPAEIPSVDLNLSLAGARAMASRTAADIEAFLDGQLAAARRGVGYAENAIKFTSALGRLDDTFAVARAMYLNEGFQIGERRFSPDQGRYMRGRERNTYILYMPPAAAMRADPRFGVLMRDIGIVDYWRRSGRGPDDPAWAHGQLG